MLEVALPTRGTLVYNHLVLDYNGTLAQDIEAALDLLLKPERLVATWRP